MSSNFTVIDDTDIKRVNWMLEEFPEDLKQQCKERAVSQRQTLKTFVENALKQALGIDMVNSANESRQTEVRRGPKQINSSASRKPLRSQARKKAKS
jgi:hypothetical protein